MAAATASTITSAVPLVPSEVAVIVAEPLDTGDTRPEALTVTTLSMDDDHTNAFPGIGSPLASCALAVNRRVSMRVVKVFASGATTTEATLRPSSFGPVPSDPPQPVNVRSVSRTGVAVRQGPMFLLRWAADPWGATRGCARSINASGALLVPFSTAAGHLGPSQNRLCRPGRSWRRAMVHDGDGSRQ